MIESVCGKVWRKAWRILIAQSTNNRSLTPSSKMKSSLRTTDAELFCRLRNITMKTWFGNTSGWGTLVNFGWFCWQISWRFTSSFSAFTSDCPSLCFSFWLSTWYFTFPCSTESANSMSPLAITRESSSCSTTLRTSRICSKIERSSTISSETKVNWGKKMNSSASWLKMFSCSRTNGRKRFGSILPSSVQPA